MNVLHLTTHVDLGGITSTIATLSKAMAARGHFCTVVSGGGNAWTSLSRAGMAGYVYPIRTKSELNPKLWLAFPKVAELVREGKFDILHAHTRVTQVFAWMLSRATGVPAVSTAHGFYKARIGRRLFPAWGERVIAISPLVAESLERSHAVPKRKIRIVQNAIDLEAFERRLKQQDQSWIKARYGIPKKAYVIGSLSRLVRDKGHEYLIEAAAQLAKVEPQVFLLIVGDGRERESLAKMAARLLPGRSKLIPGVQDTTAVFSVMDVFAHPATHREGFGLSIAEAMVARIPVVATDIPAINTLLSDRENGRIVAPKDAAVLAAAIRELIGDPGLAKKLGERGRETAVSICRPERMAAEMEKVYEEVVGEWNRS